MAGRPPVRLSVFFLLGFTAFAASPKTFELSGRVVPESHASISLFGATFAFSASTLSDARGHFRFSKLEPGSYTVAVFLPGKGEARVTIDIGPTSADRKGRVQVTIPIEDDRLAPDRHGLVSARELAIPPRAWKEYAEAQRSLGRRDSEDATAHLKRAVEIAPQFSGAWNNLGTIAYHSSDYKQAEEYFRRSLLEDPTAFEPLVNLGGVLLNLDNLDEAWKYNLYAVLKRPNDALANSQLGMTYLALGKLDLAEKYLLEARKLDPGHFSHPQRLLAEIYLRKGNRAAAADQLEDFLKYHPDSPDAGKLREGIARLRSSER